MKVIIAGAGPAGLLTAHYLLERPNYQVVIYEKRSDFQQQNHGTQQNNNCQDDKSFPIALQSRGMAAIRGITGLEAALENATNEQGEARSVFTIGISLHGPRGRQRNISRPPTLSVERNSIALTLLQGLQNKTPAQHSSLTIHFDTAVVDLDVPTKTLHVAASTKTKKEIVSFDYLIVSDGARSKIRELLFQKGLIHYTQSTTKDEYKSFYITRQSNDGSVVLDGDRVHAWMFGENRVISVPTRPHLSSGVFTFPSGKDPFSKLPDSQAVLDYFEALSKDSLAPLVTKDEAESMRTRPVSRNVEAICDRLVVGNDIVLIGDACHAVSASAGQGCNAALQDVQVLIGFLDQYQQDWTKALPAYNHERLPEAHAVWELSSFNNPQSRFMRFEFILRVVLSSLLPKFLSSILLRPLPMQLLSETDLPYSVVLEKSRWWTDRVKASSGN